MSKFNTRYNQFITETEGDYNIDGQPVSRHAYDKYHDPDRIHGEREREMEHQAEFNMEACRTMFNELLPKVLNSYDLNKVNDTNIQSFIKLVKSVIDKEMQERRSHEYTYSLIGTKYDDKALEELIKAQLDKMKTKVISSTEVADVELPPGEETLDF